MSSISDIIGDKENLKYKLECQTCPDGMQNYKYFNYY